MSHGTPTPVHGPFDLPTASEPRRQEKEHKSSMISNGRCTCELCGEHGQRGKPENPMWSTRPGKKGETYLCQGPDMSGVTSNGRPWA